MQRVSLPYTTRTTGIDVFDTDNLFRQRDIDRQIKMLNEDDGTFYKVLDMWATEEPAIQPVYFWTEDDMLGISTQVNLAAGYSAAATSIVVDDARLFVVNSEIFCPRTLENMFVTDVTYSTNTLTVTRGLNGTPAAALVDNDILVAGVPHLPELGDANEGTGRVPTTEKWNCITRFSTSFKISDLQNNCGMVDVGIGQVASVPWEVANKMLEMKRLVNKALIFQSRGTSTVADGTIYFSQGFLRYVEDNVLNVGSNNSNLTWPILSGFCDELFQPTASSKEKLIVAGPYLYGAINRMTRDMGVPPVKYYMPDIGRDMIELTTEQGNTVKVVQDRHGFPSEENLAGWGIVVDMGLVSKKEMKGEPMTWRPSIQASKSHFRQDEYFGSFSLKLRHPECHGFIRGAAAPLADIGNTNS